MEKNLFCCIPQQKKTCSVVSHEGKKPLPLYSTTEENIFHLGYNGRKPAAMWATMRKIFLCWIPQLYCVVLWDRAHRIRFCCDVGYNGRKTPALWDTMEKNLLAILRFFSVVSHNGKNLFRCIPQRRKTFSVVSHNRKKFLCCIPQWIKTSSVVSHNGKKT
jgi:hypothetical protein